MLKTITTLCIGGSIGLIVLGLAMPEQANRMVNNVITIFVSKPIQNIPSRVLLDDNKQARLKIPFLKDHISTEPGNKLIPGDIIAHTNAHRVAEGLPAMVANPKLVASAKIKVDDMIARQYFEHKSPSGKEVSDLGKEVGYSYVIMGENLALGDFISAEDLVTAWMNSPGHRANILNPSYQEIGVYVAEGSYQGRTVWFAVQHFGTTRTACPQIDNNLKKEIDIVTTQLRKQEKEIAMKREELEHTDHGTSEEYDKKVSEFNALVSKYNTALASSQKKIATYNKQVAAFNNCLAEFQKRR